MDLFLAVVHVNEASDLSGGSDCEMKRSLTILKDQKKPSAASIGLITVCVVNYVELI
jgi:hypothetical protein